MHYESNKIHLLTRYEEDNSLILVLGCFSDISFSRTYSVNGVLGDVFFTKSCRHLLQIAVKKKDIKFNYVANYQAVQIDHRQGPPVVRHQREDFGCLM